MKQINSFSRSRVLLAMAILSNCLIANAHVFAQGSTRPKEKPLAERLTSPRDRETPLVEKLRSPRETLKTLYYAVILYDRFPEMMEEATACLDLEGFPARPALDDCIKLVLDLEYVLQSLNLTLSSVPDRDAGTAVVLYDHEGLRIGLQHGADGAWRIDSKTLIEAATMRRLTQERRKQRSAVRVDLRDGFGDPRATMRQFQSDVAHGDFYAAARSLDLSALGNEQRRIQGPVLAHQLAFVLQRRGYFFRQEVPDEPDGPAYTWHADASGRIALDRVRQPDGKDAWLFTRQTVRNIPRMFAAVQSAAPVSQYVRLNLVVPPPKAGGEMAGARKRPEDVPSHLGSPREVLKGFFRTMDAADTNDARLADALEYLDLQNVPAADRESLGGKLVAKLEAVLRKIQPDLAAVPDDWNAGPLVLGEAQGVRIEVLRDRDGCWRFSEATVARVPEMFDRLAGKSGSDRSNGSHLDSARDTMITFGKAAGRGEFALAAECLDLHELPASSHQELGPVLAFKLKYIFERIGRIYVQEIPDATDGPRYVLYRGELGRIALERQAQEPAKGQWLFTADTVQRIDPVFRAVFPQAPDPSQQGAPDLLGSPEFWPTPGIWLRTRLPDGLQRRAGPLEIYQWLGIALAAILSWAGAHLLMAGVSRLVSWLLHRSGSVLSSTFVAQALKPVAWLATVWLFFQMLAWLDLSVPVAAAVFSAQKFLLAGLIGWMGLRLIDLSMGIYLNSEYLRPHRSLSDMIVPVSMRLSKGVVILAVSTYVIYAIGEIELLARFLTGLGVAGLAASLAAQDALKSFFGTLLLIGERAFKIGDRINVGGREGVVQQVGFRSTRLLTAEGSVLTVPNAVIASSAIDNLGAAADACPSTVDLQPPGQAA